MPLATIVTGGSQTFYRAPWENAYSGATLETKYETIDRGGNAYAVEIETDCTIEFDLTETGTTVGVNLSGITAAGTGATCTYKNVYDQWVGAPFDGDYEVRAVRWRPSGDQHLIVTIREGDGDIRAIYQDDS